MTGILSLQKVQVTGKIWLTKGSQTITMPGHNFDSFKKQQSYDVLLTKVLNLQEFLSAKSPWQQEVQKKWHIPNSWCVLSCVY